MPLKADPFFAPCPNGQCEHMAMHHDADFYEEGRPVRPTCCIDIDGRPCPCGHQWRNP